MALGFLITCATVVDEFNIGPFELRRVANLLLFPGAVLNVLITREVHGTTRLGEIMISVGAWCVWTGIAWIGCFLVRRAIR